MTDHRIDDQDPTTDAAMAVEPEQIIPPEQPPMDDAAGGPQADTSEDMSEVSSTGEITDEEVAAQLSSPA